MAPEVVTEGRMYDAKADIWSLGITLLEMAYGEPPMSGQPAARAVMLLGDKRMRAPRLEGDHWSKEMRDFVVGCLNEEPADRLSAEELSKSKWIKQQCKTPLTAMNDLIARYQAWKESGGQRQSLAAGVGASVDDDDDDHHHPDGHPADGDWAFDVSYFFFFFFCISLALTTAQDCALKSKHVAWQGTIGRHRQVFSFMLKYKNTN